LKTSDAATGATGRRREEEEGLKHLLALVAVGVQT